ncbi:hypothetical protein M1O54_07985 [Dehalococcoidia bacterium]|nr:hypothetical protein [Dehalococcoidia bacterium]
MQLKWSRFNVEVPVPQNNAVVIFNTLTRDIVSVDQELINSLRETEFAQLSEQELLRLRDAKIVVDQGLDEVAYMRYLLGEQKYTQAGLGLFLCFTADCNLKCSYCFEDYRGGFKRNVI